MLYFIPAWYQNQEWRENEQCWYVRRMHPETDDTVKQIQLFHRNHICSYRIMVLGHAPNLRHFLHRQGIFRAPYWSVFDAVQEVRRTRPAVLSFHSLDWPKGIEFVYTPFAVVARLHGEKYAQVEFGEYGNPIRVDLYDRGQLRRRNVYDDRGFLSCTVVYENGEMAYEQYLTERGVWKLCRFADGHVAVNPENACYLLFQEGVETEVPFLQYSYSSIEDLIREVLSSYLDMTGKGDIFCAALHGQHMRLLDALLQGRRTIFSVFEKRVRLAGNLDAVRCLSRADCIVTDSEDNLRMVLEEVSGNVWKTNIPPYDTRTESGISQQLHVRKILLPVDHLSEDRLSEAVGCLAGYLRKNEKARVHLFTRNAAYDREDILLRRVGQALERYGFPAAWARKKDQNKFEFRLEEEERMPILFVVEQCVDEMSVNKCVREQRILVDLADAPDLFLQISCVSMGIPQLLRTATRYMIPGRNGDLIRDLSCLEEQLAFYLESLSNWNQAMIHSYELGKKHTARALIAQWREVIDTVGDNTRITAGSC